MKLLIRLFDFVISVVLLFLLLPIMVVIFVVVSLKIDAKAFYIQPRPGKDGKLFNLIKFKTMRELRDDTGKYLPDSKRVTKLGHLLRSASVDELPELWNVIKGDMSLVGPRPLLPEYLPLYSTFQNKRHDILPGITGWAQVNGRNSISWEEKFELDVWYVDNQSFWLNLKILFLTIKKVITREGIAAEGEATMLAFTGSKNNKGVGG